MYMKRQIYFNELTEVAQAQILDSYGASCAADLGYDKQPYAVATYDNEDNLENLMLVRPAV